MINPVFERHLRRHENWTLGESFAKALPMLDGTYNLKTGNKTLLVGCGGDASNASRISSIPESSS